MSAKVLITGMFVVVVSIANLGLGADTVKLVRNDDVIAVTLSGKDFTSYIFGKSWPKPYFFPVKAADNALICFVIILLK